MEIRDILAIAAIIAIPAGAIIAILLAVFWLFGSVNTYLLTVMHMTGLLETLVALVATCVLAYIIAEILFGLLIVFILILAVIFIFIAAILGMR